MGEQACAKIFRFYKAKLSAITPTKVIITAHGRMGAIRSIYLAMSHSPYPAAMIAQDGPYERAKIRGKIAAFRPQSRTNEGIWQGIWGKPRRWCCRRGLNSRPQPYQGCALPLSYGSLHQRRRCGAAFAPLRPACQGGAGQTKGLS